MLELALHACDVSNSVKSFDVVRKWTYLLFEEFFHQGDLEKEAGLPISMLCDRTTVNVVKSQPGFLSFIPLPCFAKLSDISPAIQECVQALKTTSENWKEYTETDEDKNVYVKSVEKQMESKQIIINTE